MLALGQTYGELGHYAQARQTLHRALALAREAGQAVEAGQALAQLGGVSLAEEQYSHAQELLQQAVTILRDVGDPASEGVALARLGAVALAQGDATHAYELLQHALSLVHQASNRAGKGETLVYLGHMYQALQEYPQAQETLQQALAIMREVGNLPGEGLTLSSLGAVQQASGQYAQAHATLQQALAIVRPLGHRPREAAVLTRLGEVSFVLGHASHALEMLRQTLAIWHELESRADRGRAFTSLGVMYRELGWYPQAREAFQQALSIWRELQHRAEEGKLLGHLGEVHQALGWYPQAREAFQQALAIWRELQHRMEEGNLLAGLGYVYQTQGWYPQAREAFQQALSIWRELDHHQGEAAANVLGALTVVYNHLDQTTQLRETSYQLELIVQKLERERRHGPVAGVALSSVPYLISAIKPSDLSQIGEYLHQAMMRARTHEFRTEEGWRLYQLAVVYHLRGSIEERVGRGQHNLQRALEYGEHALQRAREIGLRSLEWQALTILASIYQTQGQYPQAIAAQQQVLTMAYAWDAPLMKSFALQALAKSWQAQQQYDEALGALQQALALGHRLHAPALQGKALQSLAELAQRQGQSDRVLNFWQQLLTIAQQSGDVQLQKTAHAGFIAIYKTQEQSGVAWLPMLSHRTVTIGLHLKTVVESLYEGFSSEQLARFRPEAEMLIQARAHPQQRTDLLQKLLDAILVDTEKDLKQLGEGHQEHDQLLAPQQRLRTEVPALGDPVRDTIPLQALAERYQARGQYTEALTIWQQVLTATQQRDDPAVEGEIMKNLATVYQAQGQYAQALTIWQQALELSRARGARKLEGEALAGLAENYSQVQPEKAQPFWDLAASIFFELGDANSMFAMADKRSRAFDRHTEDGIDGLDTLENCLRAFRFARVRGLPILETQALATCAHMWDRFFRQMDDTRSTNRLIRLWWPLMWQRALALFYTLDPSPDPERTRVAIEEARLNETNQVYLSRKADVSRLVLLLWRQSLALFRALGSPQGTGEALAGLGAFYSTHEQYDQALAFWQQALAFFYKQNDPVGLWKSQAGVARVLQHLGRDADALRQFTSAVETIEALHASLQGTGLAASVLDTSSFLNDKRHVYQDLVALLLRLDRTEPGQRYAYQAFRYAEQSKARGLLDQLAAASAVRRTGVLAAQLSEQLMRYQNLKAARQLWQHAQSETERLHYAQQIADLENALTAQPQRGHGHQQQESSSWTPQLLEVEDVQTTLLQAGEALLTYIWGPSALQLFVLSRAQFHVLTLPIREAELAKTLAPFLAPFQPWPAEASPEPQGSRPAPFDLQQAHHLYHTLLHPALSLLEPVHTLIIIPDGVLHPLPFELLVTRPSAALPAPHALATAYRDAPYLVHRYAITYAPSIGLLQAVRASRGQAPGHPVKTMLALAPFGDTAAPVTPCLPQPPTSPWHTFTKFLGTVGSFTQRSAADTTRFFRADSLPCSRHEVDAIQALFAPGSTQLVGHHATKAALVTHAHGYRYIHLATHGFVHAAHPVYSGLVLAQGDVLQAYEIPSLHLQADLVTLSACETGAGPLQQGEGLIGLTRAFLTAGASSVVASLWQVNDTSTAALMTAFYTNFHGRKLPKAQALQAAKRALIQQYPHPYFWAPFVLSGAWR